MSSGSKGSNRTATCQRLLFHCIWSNGSAAAYPPFWFKRWIPSVFCMTIINILTASRGLKAHVQRYDKQRFSLNTDTSRIDDSSLVSCENVWPVMTVPRRLNHWATDGVRDVVYCKTSTWEMCSSEVAPRSGASLSSFTVLNRWLQNFEVIHITRWNGQLFLHLIYSFYAHRTRPTNELDTEEAYHANVSEKSIESLTVLPRTIYGLVVDDFRYRPTQVITIQVCNVYKLVLCSIPNFLSHRQSIANVCSHCTVPEHTVVETKERKILYIYDKTKYQYTIRLKINPSVTKKGAKPKKKSQR